MSSFAEHFSEVQSYDDGYGYAVNARNVQEAVDKIEEYVDYSRRSDDERQRLRRELRENMRECWVRFQGYMDWDNEFYNCWVITSEWMGGKPRWKKVFESNYDRHYVNHGHRFEPKADEPGNRVHYSTNSCDVCNQIYELKKQIKETNECICADGQMWHSINCPKKSVVEDR